MELPREWSQMDAQELRDLTATLFSKLSEQAAQLSARDQLVARRDQELKHKQLKIDQLTYEMAILKRWRYARRSEQLDAVQRSLLHESIDADLEAIGLELEALKDKPTAPKSQPRRVALPAHPFFPRIWRSTSKTPGV